MSLFPSLVGLVAGIVIGATGVGAGALMTPVLLQVFGLPLPLAVGTDLWFAALTKLAGSVAHHRRGHVELGVVVRLLAGSVPAALLTLAALHAGWIARSTSMGLALGIALLLTAVLLLARQAWLRLAQRLHWSERRRAQLTVLLGMLLGVLVTLSSIGAGAIGAAVLVLLYPQMSARRLVGTDIAHAVPLTFVAGVGHALLGHVDWALLVALLLGSVPGIWLGARLGAVLPERATRVGVSAALLLAGFKLIA